MMKKYFCCILFTLLVLPAGAQMFFAETGKFLGNFNYKNSSGETPDLFKGSIQNNLGVGIRQSLFKSAWHLSAGTLYNKYDVKGSDNLRGNYFEWDLAFMEVDLGVDYEFFKPLLNNNQRFGFSCYVKGSVGADFLIKGTQRVNNQVSNLAGEEEFDKPPLFLRAGAGANYYFSKTFIVFTEYMFGKSFLAGDYSNQEQLKFNTHNLSIGVMINLDYSK
jgi:hypothetical protein